MLQELRPESASYNKDRKAVLDTVNGDPVLRSKSRLIDEFIRIHIDGRQDKDTPSDIESDLDKYIIAERAKAIGKVAAEEGVNEELLHEYITEFEYLGKPKNEIIKRAIEPLILTFRENQAKKKSIIEKMQDIIKLFSWN